MNTRIGLRRPALLSALLLGVLAERLILVPGRPGLNVALWALAGVIVLVLLLRRRSDPAARETRLLVGTALALAVAMVLRDDGALAILSLLGATGLLLVAAGRAGAAWAGHAQLSDIAFAVGRVALLCAAGPVGWGRAPAGADAGASEWVRGARTAARGTVMALPALVVLTALLMSADPVFSAMVHGLLRIDTEIMVQHTVFAAAIAWLSAGYLRSFLVRDDTAMSRLQVPQPALPAAEVSVALWLLNVLFAVFMVVQLRYLFGGSDLVQVTAGLGYAEYARRGFFELVATAALVVPILLLADWAAAQDNARARTMLRGTAMVLVVLLLGVIASAAYRMALYQNAYGMTEQRLYVSVIILWLTAVLGWLVLTVLRGRRDRFAIGSIVAGLACLAGLYILNPHALIARVNIERAANGQEYDGTYLRNLSGDAVPAILAGLATLPAAERCRAGAMLEEKWAGEPFGDWRTWNLGDWRARRLVAPLKGTLACPGADITSPPERS